MSYFEGKKGSGKERDGEKVEEESRRSNGVLDERREGRGPRGWSRDSWPQRFRGLTEVIVGEKEPISSRIRDVSFLTIVDSRRAPEVWKKKANFI